MAQVTDMKKRIAIWALAAVLTVGAVGTGYRAVTDTRIFVQRLSFEERLVSSTVMLMDAAKSGGGSGVLVRHNDRWYCWTAAHVAVKLGDNAIATARFFDQGICDVKVEGKVVRTVAVDEALDLAILELDLTNVGQRSATVSRKPLLLGQDVVNCGHSGLSTAPWNVVRGTVSRADGNLFGASTVSYPGCSGSGIWTTDGKLVGILSCWAGPGLTGFVPNDVMIAFAKANKIEWAL